MRWLGGRGSAALPAVRLTALVVASVTTIAAWPIFFTMPAAVLPREAHPAGIAFLNTIGIIGGALSPLIMGILRDRTGSFGAPMAVMGAALRDRRGAGVPGPAPAAQCLGAGAHAGGTSRRMNSQASGRGAGD